MKKSNAIKRLSLTTVLLGISSAGFAGPNQEQGQAQADTKAKPAPTYSPYLGDKVPPYNNPNRFLMQASFIYWQADVDGLDYALEQNLQFEETTISSLDTTVVDLTYTNEMKNKDLNFQWDPGFKTGIGVIFGEMDEWDLVLNWTWLQSKAHRSQNTGAPANFIEAVSEEESTTQGDFLVPAPSPDFLGTPAVNAKTRWRMHYNTLDLELGRNFYLAKSLTMRPHIGLRGAWIHQTTKMNYDLASLTSGYSPFMGLAPSLGRASSAVVSGDTTGTSQFKGKNSYNGVGLRGGFDMRWNFTKHFCVYSSLAASILYGQFKVEESFDANYSITNAAVSPITITSCVGDATLTNSYHRTRTTLQAILGLLWHASFYNDMHHMYVSMGYEVNEWFQQNELRSVIGDAVPFTLKSNRTNGDLGLHGLTVDIRYDF